MNQLGFFSFKSNDVTSDTGPRNAAVLTFSGNSDDSFVKELTQNSLDARSERGGKLKIRVESKLISKNQISKFEQFEKFLGLMEKYWNKKSDQYEKFFKNAKSSIKGDKLNVLIFEDFFTQGLIGDDEKGTFKNCVNDENVSGKEHLDSLGNHGIGKNSVFSYSGVHMVLYSSLNKLGEFKFKGVSKLGNYIDESGIKRSDRIYYGDVNNESVKLVSDPDLIPPCFKRSDVGLSQFVIGAELNENWITNVKKSFISNYWYLFELGILDVSIQGEDLNNLNYQTIADKLFLDDKTAINPLPYIKAFKEKLIYKSKELFKIGNVHLFLKEADEGEHFPNRIVTLRDGMKIVADPLGMSGLPLSVAGVLFCDNPEGNSILGAMEPHAHNEFIAKLVEKKKVANVSVTDAEKILKEIKNFKKSVLEELRQKYTENVDSIEIVDDLFSSLFGIGKGSGAGNNVDSDKETFDRRIFELDYSGILSSNSRNSIIDNTGELNLGDGDGDGVGIGTGGKGLKGGTGRNAGAGGGSSESEKKTKGKTKQKINARFFISTANSNLNTYKMILRSTDNLNSCDISFSQFGDSGRNDGEMTSILKNVTQNGKVLNFEEIKNQKNQIIGYKIKSISITQNEPSICDIQIEENSISALQLINLK